MDKLNIQNLKVNYPSFDVSEGNFCFIDFVRLFPLQEDDEINSFMTYAKGVPNFRITSDPIKLCEYLYKKLNPIQTIGFQKTYLLFASVAKKNDIPEPYKSDRTVLIEALQHISQLQSSIK